jgi:hypothetical protein
MEWRRWKKNNSEDDLAKLLRSIDHANTDRPTFQVGYSAGDSGLDIFLSLGHRVEQEVVAPLCPPVFPVMQVFIPFESFAHTSLKKTGSFKLSCITEVTACQENEA